MIQIENTELSFLTRIENGLLRRDWDRLSAGLSMLVLGAVRPSLDSCEKLVKFLSWDFKPNGRMLVWMTLPMRLD